MEADQDRSSRDRRSIRRASRCLPKNAGARGLGGTEPFSTGSRRAPGARLRRELNECRMQSEHASHPANPGREVNPEPPGLLKPKLLGGDSGEMTKETVATPRDAMPANQQAIWARRETNHLSSSLL
jgi:hypothetical protein